MSCRLLHLGDWNAITVWKLFPSGSRVKLLTTKNKTNVTLANSPYRSRLFGVVENTRYSTELKFWIYSLVCDDAAMYACEADVPFALNEAYGKLLLKGTCLNQFFLMF